MTGYALRDNPLKPAMYNCPDCNKPIAFPEGEIEVRCDSCRNFFFRPIPQNTAFNKINFNGGKCACNGYVNCHDCRDGLQFNIDRDAAASKKERQKLLDDLENELSGVTDVVFGFLPVTDSVNKAGLIRWIKFKRES